MNILALTKALTEGLAVAFAAYFIPRRETSLVGILTIALAATATFLILDYLAPEVGMSARQGAGFGMGLNQVGWQSGGFEDCKFTCANNPRKCQSPGPCQRGSVKSGGSIGDSCGACDSVEEEFSQGGNGFGSEEMSNASVTCGRSQPNWDQCQAPIDVGFLKEPWGVRGFGTEYSSTNVGSRPMNFTENGCPVNRNIHEYKLVPGNYSKYVLRSGYNQNVGTYNENEYRE